MPNKRWNKQVGHSNPAHGHPTGRRGPLKSDAPYKTAAWPGVPGKTQSESRDRAGTPKIKTSMKSEGVC